MSLTDRDKKIAMLLVPVMLVVGYWFLVLAPKRQEANKLGAQLTEAQDKRDAATAQVDQLEGSKNSYAKDYETVVRLGKAIPATLGMPSLLVQLEDAAKGTHIRFSRVRAGDRNAAPAPPAPPTSAPGQGGDAAAGGEKASTGAGNATEQANGAAKTSDSANAAAGATPAAGASGTAADGTTSGAPGLDSVPLEFTFSGSFFDLADFFHEMKRFVRVANKNIRVTGRLMTIDRLSFKSDRFPVITAEVSSTVYLSPKSQGTTAGATPQGPATDGATPASAPATNPAAPANSPVAQSGDSAR